jgi:hypothetical protein
LTEVVNHHLIYFFPCTTFLPVVEETFLVADLLRWSSIGKTARRS